MKVLHPLGRSIVAIILAYLCPMLWIPPGCLVHAVCSSMCARGIQLMHSDGTELLGE